MWILSIIIKVVHWNALFEYGDLHSISSILHLILNTIAVTPVWSTYIRICILHLSSTPNLRVSAESMCSFAVNTAATKWCPGTIRSYDMYKHKSDEFQLRYISKNQSSYEYSLKDFILLICNMRVQVYLAHVRRERKWVCAVLFSESLHTIIEKCTGLIAYREWKQCSQLTQMAYHAAHMLLKRQTDFYQYGVRKTVQTQYKPNLKWPVQ